MKIKECNDIESYFSFPTRATLYMTTRCNFNCFMCNKHGNVPDAAPDMSLGVVEKLLTSFPSIKGICICGLGEPLLCNTTVPIVHYLRSKGIFSGMITNGSLLTDKLESFNGIYPNYISVSLNASNAISHSKMTGTNTFDKVIEGIKLLVQKNIDIYLSYVCRKDNVSDIPGFIMLAKSLGVKKVYLHNLLPNNENDMSDFENNVFTIEDAHIIESWKSFPGSEVVDRYPILIEKSPLQKRFCKSPWTMMNVDGNGSISICNSIYPPHKSNGSIMDDAIIWNNDYCKQFRSTFCNELNKSCSRCFRNWDNVNT